MPRGTDSSANPNRRPPRPEPQWEIGKHSLGEAHDRVGFHLVSNQYDPLGPLGHGAKRFGSHEEALSYVEKNRLALKAPEPSLPPSDAGDVGWAGRK